MSNPFIFRAAGALSASENSAFVDWLIDATESIIFVVALGFFLLCKIDKF